MAKLWDMIQRAEAAARPEKTAEPKTLKPRKRAKNRTFDRKAYMREYMRLYRKGKAAKS